ncbi:MAG: hypothetical protein KAQ83_03175 [Nanoarchaeota archaeon]|nr:hypothetical protein [Nanoarchaeota archaeon]
MRKRGSLNLSINAIVVLILAITMLGLGLAFMRNIFGGATEEFQKTSGEIEKQMIDQMKESNKVVSLSRPKVNIKIGEKDQIFLGLKNDQQDPIDFTINNIVCESLGGGTSSQLNCGAGGDVTLAWKESATTIGGGEVVVLPINIKVSTQANEGTCFCTLPVSAGTEIKNTELTIDVKV